MPPHPALGECVGTAVDPGAVDRVGVVTTALLAAAPFRMPPPLPELDNPTLIQIIDVVRAAEVLIGLTVAALLVRSLLRIPEELRPLQYLKSHRVRVTALAVGLLLLALQAYQRLGEPVSIIFPVGLIFLVLSTYALYVGMTLPPPMSQTEERLARFDPPKWARPDKPDDDE